MGYLLYSLGKLFPKTASGLSTLYFYIAIISQSPSAIEPTTAVWAGNPQVTILDSPCQTNRAVHM